MLKDRIGECLKNQQAASDREDYDEAEMLGMRIEQTELLVENKRQSMRTLKDDFSVLEAKKSNGYKDLKKLIEESNAKLQAIHLKEKEERKSLEESETSAIEQRRKKIKMDTIRVEVTREELDSDQHKAQEALEEIEEKVKAETQESQK